MAEHRISSLQVRDVRFPLAHGAGSDSIHSGSEYAFATTLLAANNNLFGSGMVLTLGRGNELVCQAIEMLGEVLVEREIEGLMADFGAIAGQLAQHPQLRWLGPHKGVVHLALASIINACFDLWAKAREVPLWRLLLDLTPQQIVSLLDLSYLEDVLTPAEARRILEDHFDSRADREAILRSGYPGYDTSVGWFQYEDSRIKQLAREALDQGFRAFKLKVGSPDRERDLRRAFMLRELAPDALIMLDVNQQWTLPTALEMCRALSPMSPFFVEEPTHPDDIQAHSQLAAAITPMRIALGEHIPNRVMFKNFMQARGLHFAQVDCTRVAGISEFLAVSLLAKKFALPVVPHVGDMGQIHQHLVLFNHIAMGHEALFLECIPHLQDRFVLPAQIENGVYVTPQEPGCSSDLKGVVPKESGAAVG
jgi:L-fuconate dehydratase